MTDDHESTTLHETQLQTKGYLTANGSAKGDIVFNMGSVGERIREARKGAGLSQTEIAKTLGVSRTAVANWERGEGVKQANLLAVARLTGVTTDWLMSGDGKRPAVNPSDRLLVDSAVLAQLLGSSYEILGIPKAHALQLAVALLEAAALNQPLDEGLKDPARSRWLAASLVKTFLREPR